MTTREGKALPVMLIGVHPLHDIGNAHIIVWYLWRAVQRCCHQSIDLWTYHPARYADGEEAIAELYQ